MKEENTRKQREVIDNERYNMKQNPDYDTIDLKFIEAIDTVLEKNDELGIKPSNDSSLGKLIYPSNRSIISSVRSRAKHIPHLALINFAKLFDVDMNYFYSDRTLNYIPRVRTSDNRIDNSIKVTGDGSFATHAGSGTIRDVKNVAKEIINHNTTHSNPSAETIINNFIQKIDENCIPDFYSILNAIRDETGSTIAELKYHLKKKSKKLDKLNERHHKELKTVNLKLTEACERMIEAQENEKQTMLKYITLLENK
ncbi:hypothetical protein ACWGOQ_0014490 [Aquimarina sp. M1]